MMIQLRIQVVIIRRNFKEKYKDEEKEKANQKKKTLRGHDYL